MFLLTVVVLTSAGKGEEKEVFCSSNWITLK